MRRGLRTGIILSGIGAAVGLAAATAWSGGEDAASPARAAKVRLGVFDSRAIAVAYAPSRFNTQVQQLLAERAKAQAAGDAKRVAEIEEKGKKAQDRLHHQGFGREPVDDLLAHIRDSFPEVCREAGVDAIVTGVVHAGPTVETADVTDLLVKRFEPKEKTLRAIEQVRKTKPLDAEEFPLKEGR